MQKGMVEMNQNDIKNYKKIIKDIKENEEKCPINIYFGDVNRDYIYDLSKMEDKKINSMDLIMSDGMVESSKDNNGNTLLSINEASYVIISTISTNSKDEKPITTNYSVIFDPAAFGFFQALILGNKDTDLFERITTKDGYLKGTIDEFIEIKEPKRVTIYPTSTKSKQRKR